MRPVHSLSLGIVFVVTSLAACADTDLGSIPQASSLEARLAKCADDPRVIAGTVSVDICTGADLFFREEFNGNGRSCATCHPVDNNFTIEPAFIATLPPDDPLFIAEFDPELEGLEIPAQMRARGLILENADSFDPDPRERFVLRSVPHNFSMGTSVTRAPGDLVNPPAERTGWSGDGAPGAGALRDFQTGAIIQHYTRSLDRIEGEDFRPAENGELDRIDLFMRQLGRTDELTLATVALTDAGAEAGRLSFLAVGCNGCHVNAGANAAFGGGGNRNFNTGVEAARNAALAAFPRDGGFGRAPANPDGSFGNGRFNTPPVIEAADTGPFFHTDTTVAGASAHNASTATTIEEAVAFYDTPAFNQSPSGAVGPIDLTAAQIDELGRFMRVINASFNAQLASKRLDAARAVLRHFHDEHVATQRELLRLARVEIVDAIEVLGKPNLNVESRIFLRFATMFLDEAIATHSVVGRAIQIDLARSFVRHATSRLGTGLTLTIGDGTVMF